MAKVLVVGGAGYIGSTVAAVLLDRGHDVWVLDDLSRGYREFVLCEGFTRARAGDREAVSKLLSSESFDCAMHFAAYALVGESVEKPELYYENNVEQTQVLLEELLKAGVDRLIFSSSCAIFGDPGNVKISESTPKAPMNPYGKSKLQAENLMQESVKEGLKTISLRYFNAVGAESKLRVGEDHQPETHLIPNIFKAIESGEDFLIFGTDYDTPDGTCVRDLVHVEDLAKVHVGAMERLLEMKEDGGTFEAYNIGGEKGYSVLEVVAAVSRVLGVEVPVQKCSRRKGDPAFLVAESERAKRELGFNLSHSSIDKIIDSAWSWYQKRKQA